ncbi:kunitz-type serine protease inhibitor-like [Drosophila serrata]|uniref:kunitz-type serine protease inhibitor-like n=1 Tax=Drosophila serrata TaxID=7274 RepID=UPI000A1CFD64|nr:kunitz-type serine protease inhibitor-like [Drosophila serrata]
MDFAFLGLLLTLLLGHSSTFVYRNQACYQLSAYGTCHGHTLMWAYSLYDHRCLSFPYSTCGGNTNRFRTRADCEKACMLRYS